MAKRDFRGSKHTDYVKPSERQAWGEKSAMPIFTKPMEKQEIEQLRNELIISYNCPPNDIEYTFQKIRDIDDEDRDDCLWLKYTQRRVEFGKQVKKDVFSLKVPIPEQLRKRADELAKEAKNRNVAAQRMICETVEASRAATVGGVAQAPQATHVTPQASPQSANASAPRPKVQRPNVVGRK
jgi:hypothetical protein